VKPILQTGIAILALVMSLAVMAQPNDPEELVRATTDKVVQILESHQEELEQKPGAVYGLVKETVLPHFDFRSMSKLVMGHYWRRASEAQREAFVAEFRQLLVRTYAKSLREYEGQEIAFLPTRERPDAGEVTVRTEIRDGSGMPIPIDYRLHPVDGSWKVFDVSVDGISLVTNYRSTFSQKIRRAGIDGLIEELRQNNQERSS